MQAINQFPKLGLSLLQTPSFTPCPGRVQTGGVAVNGLTGPTACRKALFESGCPPDQANWTCGIDPSTPATYPSPTISDGNYVGQEFDSVNPNVSLRMNFRTTECDWEMDPGPIRAEASIITNVKQKMIEEANAS